MAGHGNDIDGNIIYSAFSVAEISQLILIHHPWAVAPFS